MFTFGHPPYLTRSEPLQHTIASILWLASCAVTPTLSARDVATPEAKLKKPAAESLGDQTLPEVVVTAEGSRGYAAPETTTSGLKTNTRLLEIPQAISIVPEELIKDQDARTLGDVLKNVAGVTPGGYYSEW